MGVWFGRGLCWEMEMRLEVVLWSFILSGALMSPPPLMPLTPPPISPYPSTSDHCLSHLSQYVVHLGEHNLQWPDGYKQIRMATESFPHPDFNNSVPNKDHRNDIMLVKMAAPAFISRAVRPLTLSSRCVTPGTNCLISGWGTISSPQCKGSTGEHGGQRVAMIMERHRKPKEPSKMRVTVL